MVSERNNFMIIDHKIIFTYISRQLRTTCKFDVNAMGCLDHAQSKVRIVFICTCISRGRCLNNLNISQNLVSKICPTFQSFFLIFGRFGALCPNNTHLFVVSACWKSAPEFRIVGKVLKNMFRNAVLVNHSNMANGEALITSNRAGKQRNRNTIRSPRKIFNKHSSKQFNEKSLENTLFYYQRSPTFCDRDPSADVHGTTGRKCNRNTTGVGSCSSMCCGRGYNLVKERRVEKCQCKFLWCCKVECKECHSEEWISTCK